MFPISSAALTTPANISPVAESAAVAPVRADLVTAADSATDAPTPASVSVELSPVANFLLTVSQSQQQLAQLQDPEQAATLNETTQNVVNAFNLLPAVDFNQTEPQGPSLLSQLVESLNNANQQQQTAAQNLARIGLTLQPPLLSDATGGLSLDNEVLRAAFRSNQQATTDTLQNTLNTFSSVATRFAEQLSANPALAAAIAAYNINTTGANARATQTATEAIPRVPAVAATARSPAIGNAP